MQYARRSQEQVLNARDAARASARITARSVKRRSELAGESAVSVLCVTVFLSLSLGAVVGYGLERSRAEIERMLTRYKAIRFASGWSENGAVILFEVHERRIRFDLPMPDVDDKKFTLVPGSSWKKRTADAARKAYEQACRSRWRALALVIKAKLEAVESGITTVAGWVGPQIAEAYANGTMPSLMLGAGPSAGPP